MGRVMALVFSGMASILIYLSILLILRSKTVQSVIRRNWPLHPNGICIWRVLLGWEGLVFYFVFGEWFLGILLFTISAMLDGVDGLVARKANLITPLGEFIDPLADKATYLAAFWCFYFQSRQGLEPLVLFTGIELVGQFLVRYILAQLDMSISANNFGKIKAVLCFALVIYMAAQDDGLGLPDITYVGLVICNLFALASILFKFVPNRLYADILSILNFVCGGISLYLITQHRYLEAVLAIIAGQIFDLFDGRMADRHGGTKFGPFLDDLADFVSFGIAPAVMVIHTTKGSLPALFGLGLAYSCAVGYRLFRFLRKDKHDQSLQPGIFNGLPSPAGAVIMLGTCLVFDDMLKVGMSVILVALLMISRIRFAHFGRLILKRVPKAITVLSGGLLGLVAALVIKTGNTELFGLGMLVMAGSYLIIGSQVRLFISDH